MPVSIDDRSLGLVIPAYRPDWDLLAEYIGALERELDPDAIRIELDAPTSAGRVRAETVPATVRISEARRGKGRAITEGFDALDTDLMGFVDADGSTAASSFAEVVGALDEGADVAIGSRRADGAQVTGTQRVRGALRGGLSVLAQHMLDLDREDVQCGAKAMTRRAWTVIEPHLQEHGFAWDLDVLANARAEGLSIVEVPVRWHHDERSSVNVGSAVVEFTRALVSIRRRVGRRV